MAAKKRDEHYGKFPVPKRVRLQLIEGGMGKATTKAVAKRRGRVDHQTGNPIHEDALHKQQEILRQVSTRLTLTDRSISSIAAEACVSPSSVKHIMELSFLRGPILSTLIKVASVVLLDVVVHDDDKKRRR